MAQLFFLVAHHKSTIMKADLMVEAQETLDAVRAFKTGSSQQPFAIKKYVEGKGLLQMTLWNTSATTSHNGAMTCEVNLTTVKVDLNEGVEALKGKLHRLVDSPFNEADSKLLVDQLNWIPQEVGSAVRELVGEICESLVAMVTVKAIPAQQRWSLDSGKRGLPTANNQKPTARLQCGRYACDSVDDKTGCKPGYAARQQHFSHEHQSQDDWAEGGRQTSKGQKLTTLHPGLKHFGQNGQSKSGQLGGGTEREKGKVPVETGHLGKEGGNSARCILEPSRSWSWSERSDIVGRRQVDPPLAGLARKDPDRGRDEPTVYSTQIDFPIDGSLNKRRRDAL